jgi:phosphatidylserine/phosphatidylglycerophosphate/cardiolipin synthase-like enzyme
VITGSYNFSYTAENVNDENLLVLHDRELTQLYLEEFNRVWR